VGQLATLRYKLRYNPLPRLMINGLKRLGIVVLPYYLFDRQLRQEALPAESEGCELVLLGAGDMAAIAEMPMANSAESEYRSRLAHGQRCYGLKVEGELVGYCWMDPARCSFPPEDFALPANAAYAFDIYTLPARRGENLAARLNALFHRQMYKDGVRTMFSVVDKYNLPSLRFAAKIGVRPRHLAVHVKLFGGRDRRWLIRRYGPGASMQDGRPVDDERSPGVRGQRPESPDIDQA
jgi:hypothetical protein